MIQLSSGPRPRDDSAEQRPLTMLPMCSMPGHGRCVVYIKKRRCLGSCQRVIDNESIKSDDDDDNHGAVYTARCQLD